MKYEHYYEEMRKRLTDEEIAESVLIPADLSEAEQKEAEEAFRKIRFERLGQMTEDQKIYADLLQLRFQLEDYVLSRDFDAEKSFAHYLTRYIHIFHKTKKQFAADLAVHVSRLSRLLREKETPNIELMYRLESHSGELIPALLWWKLLSKKQEFEILTNQEQRKLERARVKNAFSHSA